MQPKYLELKSGRKILRNTAPEDATINAGIAADPDTYQVSAQEFKRLRRPGRPPGSGTKTQITLRIDTDVLERFKATGDGWQTRINDVLRAHA